MKKLFCFLTLLALVTSSCSGSGNSRTANSIKLEFTYLPELFEGHYEAFVINGGDYLSLAQFTINAKGEMYETNTNKKIRNNVITSKDNIKRWDELVITVEADNDEDPRPSVSRILEAEISEEMTESPFKFKPINLENIRGGYQLFTPTDEDANNESSGIWFSKFERNQEVKGLVLPPTPFGWVYQGWVLKDFQFISTGRFGDAYGKDWFNDYSGSELNIRFPGEDFISNQPAGFKFPMKLNDGKTRVFITVEPFDGKIDPSGENPFRFKILDSEIPADLKARTSVDFTVVKDQIPGGMLVFM